MKSIQLIFAHSSVVFELQHYRLLAERVEQHLEQEVIELKKAHEEMTKKWDSFERAEFFENAHDEYWQLSKIYPEIQRKSGVISVYSVFENHLNRLCNLYKLTLDTDIVLNDFGESDIIKRAQIYLTKVAKTNFPKDHASWAEIQKLQQIRNKLVHSEGNVPTGNSQLTGYIGSSPHIALTDGNKIILKSGFIGYCTDVFSEFFEEFYALNIKT